MKPAAARLLLLSGPSAYRRIAGIVAGVAVGTGMLLVLLGAYLHMPDRDGREAWASGSGQRLEQNVLDQPIVPAPTDSTLLTSSWLDYFDGLTIDVVAIAATADTKVVQPSGQPLPGPGEFYASPHLAEMIAAYPDDQLGDRYGTLAGIIEPSMLKGPSQRIVLVGDEWDEVAQRASATVGDGFATVSRYGQSSTFQVVLAVGAIAILVPIVLLISIVSQLGAAERRERFATVRLIGAGRRTVAGMIGLEMLVASLMGGAIGIGVAALLRPAAAQLGINGTTSYEADLTPGLTPTVVIVLALALISAATAWWRTYRDDVGALGASRERAEKPVRWTRSLILLLGIGMLTASGLASATMKDVPDVALLGLVGGFAMVAFGLIIAGPWITRATARVLGRFANSAPTLVAAGRLKRHPRATFRSVAGLIVAVFLVSVFAGVTAAIQSLTAEGDKPGLLKADALVASVNEDADVARIEGTVSALNGVTGAVPAWMPNDDSSSVVMEAQDARSIGAADVPESGAVSLDIFEMLSSDFFATGETPEVTPADPIVDLKPAYVIVLTDGQRDSLERARTALVHTGEVSLAPITRADFVGAGAQELTYELATMAYLGMGLAVGISALALTVATVSAALERRRTFGLLRLGGMRVSQLRATVSLEAATPLAATLLASVGLGFFVAWIFLYGLNAGFGLALPDARYWVALAISVGIGAAAIALSFSTVRKSTELESTRFE